MNSKYHWPIIGHSNIKEYLQKQITNEAIPHALLFSGPNKVGKLSLAKLFTLSLLCNAQEKKPCNNCVNCQHIESGVSSDYVYICREEDKQKISIKQIRQLQQQLSLKSFDTNHKIIIINDADDLTEEASNALLKTLEEPYPRITFIIITSKIEKIPATIKSRCQILNFNLVPIFQIENWLISKNIDKKDVRTVSNLSLGKPGVAINYLENKQSIENQKEQVRLLIDIIKSKTISEKFSLAANYLNKSITTEEIINLLENWEQLTRDFLIAKTSKSISNISFLPSIRKISEAINLKVLISYQNKIKDSKKLINSSINPKLVMENLILQL